MAEKYKTSLDTQKGKKHCVLRQSVTRFEDAHTYTPPVTTTTPGSNIRTVGFDINPDTVKVSAYTGHEASFSVSVTPKEALELQVYFLLHLTTDMQDIIGSFKKEIGNIVAELLNINEWTAIGIGKFSDIAVFPVVKLPVEVAPGIPVEMKGYVFSNIQKLTTSPDHPDSSRAETIRARAALAQKPTDADLINALKDAENKESQAEREWKTYIDKIKGHFDQSANDAIDEPESVLDAIAQVTACTDIINWEKNYDVYKLMIVVTDTESKRAGHGNIIGNYAPNDGSCKISKREQTLKTIKTDYIHPHLLEKSLSEQNIRVLIVTKSELVDYYTRLTESFKHQVVGIQSYEEFTTDRTLTDKIKTVLLNQNRAIKFNVDDLKSKFYVKTVLKCTSEDAGNEESLFCPDVAVDNAATLSVTFTDFKSTCGSKTIRFNFGLTSSYVKVNGFFELETTVDQFCECPCTTVDSAKDANDADCSDHGKLICGKCACNDGFEGDTCQCQKNVVITGSDVECSDTKPCGRYGKCVCGKCVCPNSHEQFYGEGCSKSDFNCPITQNGLCNGKGRCVKSRCECDDGFDGPDCAIDERRMHGTCKRYAISDICTARGECMEGICKCRKGFGGKYCEWDNFRTEGCSDFTNCMIDYFGSEKGNAYDKPVETVDIISDYSDYRLLVCVELVKNCQRVYRLHFNHGRTDIEKITVLRLDRAKDCHEDVNFKKTLTFVCLITAAVTIVIVVIVGFVYHFYFKNRQEQRSEEERHTRQWVLTSAQNDWLANDDAAPQEAS